MVHGQVSELFILEAVVDVGVYTVGRNLVNLKPGEIGDVEFRECVGCHYNKGGELPPLKSFFWFVIQHSLEIIHRLDVGDCGLVDDVLSIFALENDCLNHWHFLERFKLLISYYHLVSLLDDYFK